MGADNWATPCIFLCDFSVTSGVIGGSVSKNTTHLVMKSKGSGSSKETKVISLGVTIFTVEELEDLLK